jgi:hypothetical protein
VAIHDERRILLPVAINGHAEEPLLLDTGAFHTILSEDCAAAVGVVPTGEPPLWVKPPFLAESELWVGVVQRMAVGEAALYGERVLVAKNPRMFGDGRGVLGIGFLRRFVVDVDSPSEVVRIWDEGRFRPAADQKRVRIVGTSPRVEGDITGVARGHVVLDTGMPDNILVHAPLMAVRHRRARGTDAQIGAQDARGASPDYHSYIPGLRLGPFTFPRMEVLARDREREKLGIGVAAPAAQAAAPAGNTPLFELPGFRVELMNAGPPSAEKQRSANTGTGIAIAGMGLMRYFRLSFDVKRGFLFASAGPAHKVLNLIGADIEAGDRGPTVGEVVAFGQAENAGLERGDVILRVDGAKVGDVHDARARVLAHTGYYLHLEVGRNGSRRHVMIDVAPPPSP